MTPLRIISCENLNDCVDDVTLAIRVSGVTFVARHDFSRNGSRASEKSRLGFLVQFHFSLLYLGRPHGLRGYL